LLRAFLDAADRDGTASFLETDVEQNVRLYEKFGFTVTSQADILGIETHFMTRAPRSLSNPD
jgi:ribosomal protein S18 acetylase RimI-like enzyme